MQRKMILLSLVIFLSFIFLSGTGMAAAEGLNAASDYQGASQWAVPELDNAAEYGLITDRIKGNMNQPVTREELAEITIKLYEQITGSSAPSNDLVSFADTKNPEILKAYSLGIVSGTNLEKHLFSPNQLTNREQVAAMLYRTLKLIGFDLSVPNTINQFNDSARISAYATEAVSYMNSKGFILGSAGVFNPQGTCTREMAVLIATRVYENAEAIDNRSENVPSNDPIDDDTLNQNNGTKTNPQPTPLPSPSNHVSSTLSSMIPYLPDAMIHYEDEWDGGDGTVMYSTDYSIADIVKLYTDKTIYKNLKIIQIRNDETGKRLMVTTNGVQFDIMIAPNQTDDGKANVVQICAFWHMIIDGYNEIVPGFEVVQ